MNDVIKKLQIEITFNKYLKLMILFFIIFITTYSINLIIEDFLNDNFSFIMDDRETPNSIEEKALMSINEEVIFKRYSVIDLISTISLMSLGISSYIYLLDKLRKYRVKEK